MAEYNFDVSQSPSGICPPKLARQIKVALGINKKPKIIYAGTNFPGTDNLQSGTYTVKVRTLTAGEQATMLAAIQAHNPCADLRADNKPDAGYDYDDLDDLLAASFPGQIVYVRDLDRIGLLAGKGTMVYRCENGFRRLSNDTIVYPLEPQS